MTKGNYYSGSSMGTRLGGDGCLDSFIFIIVISSLIGCGVKSLSTSTGKNQPETEPKEVKQDTVRKGWAILVGDALQPDTVLYNHIAQKAK